jgi:hypothetical protein
MPQEKVFEREHPFASTKRTTASPAGYITDFMTSR